MTIDDVVPDKILARRRHILSEGDYLKGMYLRACIFMGNDFAEKTCGTQIEQNRRAMEAVIAEISSYYCVN